MISIYAVFIKGERKKVVDSYELYMKMGLIQPHYARWIAKVLYLGTPEEDYITDKALLQLNRKIKKRYYFTLEFARAMCMKTFTNKSVKLIRFLKFE